MVLVARTYSKEVLPSSLCYGLGYTVDSCNVSRARTLVFRYENYNYRL
jgi:hypothetical protein